MQIIFQAKWSWCKGGVLHFYSWHPFWSSCIKIDRSKNQSSRRNKYYSSRWQNSSMSKNKGNLNYSLDSCYSLLKSFFFIFFLFFFLNRIILWNLILFFSLYNSWYFCCSWLIYRPFLLKLYEGHTMENLYHIYSAMFLYEKMSCCEIMIPPCIGT